MKYSRDKVTIAKGFREVIEKCFAKNDKVETCMVSSKLDLNEVQSKWKYQGVHNADVSSCFEIKDTMFGRF